MNYRYVFSQLGLLFLVLSLIMLVMAGGFFVTHIFVHDYIIDPYARTALIFSGAIGLTIGGGLYLLTRKGSKQLGRREAMLLVAMSWLIGAAYAGLPFYFWATINPHVGADHPFSSFVDCYFESMSGLTTTGATILTDIESTPRSLLLWRALTHWLGGLGIVVLFVAVLPSLGVGAKKLFRLETPGPSPKGLRPHIRETARALMLIYSSITVAAILAIRATGAMGWFESICHAFSMVSTGGLSTRDSSIGAFDSVSLDVICLFFMFLAGVNFALFYMLMQGRWRAVLKDTELRVYFFLKVIVILVVTFNIWGHDIISTAGRVIEHTSLAQSLRFSAFQTIALHTGTGFVTADYDPWPLLSRTLLVGLMFIGGCAGSTAGGLKVIRFWMLLKILASEIEKTFRPNVIRPLRIGNSTMDADVKLGTVVFTVSFTLILLLGTTALLFLEPADSPNDVATALSASLATLGNIGPGLHGVGATQNYAWFSPGSKFVLSLLMALGRLEIFTLLVLCAPKFWKAN